MNVTFSIGELELALPEGPDPARVAQAMGRRLADRLRDGAGRTLAAESVELRLEAQSLDADTLGGRIADALIAELG